MSQRFKFALAKTKERNKYLVQHKADDKPKPSQGIKGIPQASGEAEENLPLVPDVSKNKEYYEVILRWDPLYWPKHSFEYQKLSFKAPYSFTEAVAKAQEIASLLAKCATPHTEKRKLSVEVCAVYRREVFKDWSSEAGYLYKSNNDFIKQTLDKIKEDKQDGKSKLSKPTTKMMTVR